MALIKEPFSGYYHREVPEHDRELTEVGPGTPCGEYLRRFWHPVGMTAALKDLPKRIRVMAYGKADQKSWDSLPGLIRRSNCPDLVDTDLVGRTLSQRIRRNRRAATDHLGPGSAFGRTNSRFDRITADSETSQTSHGPHSTDIPIKHIQPLLLKVNAGAYMFEAANVRHEHG